jgi:deoxyribose-phosphate aldolase
MIDVNLLDPAMPEEQVAAICERARGYAPACVTVRPSDVQLASKWLGDLVCGTVIGGEHTTAAKLYEIRDLLSRGAREFTVHLNLGKLISRQFKYLETELLQVTQQCREAGARTKFVLELETLPADLRVVACKLTKRAEADYGRASSRVTPADEGLDFLRVRFGDVVKMDAGGDVRTLAEAKRLFAGGCPRFASAGPWDLLDAWRAELAARETAALGIKAPNDSVDVS